MACSICHEGARAKQLNFGSCAPTAWTELTKLDNSVQGAVKSVQAELLLMLFFIVHILSLKDEVMR